MVLGGYLKRYYYLFIEFEGILDGVIDGGGVEIGEKSIGIFFGNDLLERGNYILLFVILILCFIIFKIFRNC